MLVTNHSLVIFASISSIHIDVLSCMLIFKESIMVLKQTMIWAVTFRHKVGHLLLVTIIII